MTIARTSAGEGFVIVDHLQHVRVLWDDVLHMCSRVDVLCKSPGTRGTSNRDQVSCPFCLAIMFPRNE